MKFDCDWLEGKRKPLYPGKSVGWGWLGYHAFLAGRRLSEFVPPILACATASSIWNGFRSVRFPTADVRNVIYGSRRRPLMWLPERAP